MKRITEYNLIATIAETDLLPIVDVSDTSQASTGSTKKGSIEKIADYVKNRTETLTNKTLTSPKVNEGVAVTATSTELNQLDGRTLSGQDSTIITGSKGTNGDLSVWNSDGDLVDGPTPPTGTIVGTTDTQTLTNKTLTTPKINEDVALTANSTELNLLDNQTVLRKQNISGNSYGQTVAAGETKYIGHGLAAGAYTSGFVFACAGTIRNLYVYTGGAPGVGQTYTCTLMKDNVAQSVTCTIQNADGNAKSDTSNSFSVSASQRVSLRFVSSASAASTIVQFAFQFEPN